MECSSGSLGIAEKALPNKRIISIENDSVSFKWRDYKDGSKQKMFPRK
ncbi:transposase [Desulfosporosinus sp. BICA1-9]